MQTKDFDYDLPKELIAQTPAARRDGARLLVMDRQSGALTHDWFYNLRKYLRPGDLLVMNDSKVIPARLFGYKKGSGGQCELLLLREISPDVWECLAKPGRRLPAGTICEFGDGLLQAEILETQEDGNKLVRMHHSASSIYKVLDQIGKMPLPHYITEILADNDHYQTVYANAPGSAAAPTAGLHFTKEQLEILQNDGIEIVKVTLHVGLGTFRPVKVKNFTEHKMHAEWYTITEEMSNKINKAKRECRKIIAVGTTSVRALESCFALNGKIQAGSAETAIFIYPGFKFNVIDGLITNFHLPQSTLIMLVSAFAGYDHTMAAYKTAVEEKYRFFSFGDAMLIL